MRLQKWMSFLCLAAGLPHVASANQCPPVADVCERLRGNSVVFVGVAESMSPPPTRFGSVAERIKQIIPTSSDEEAPPLTPDQFQRLRALYAEILAGTDEGAIAAAKDQEELEAALTAARDRGQRTTFLVLRGYQGASTGEQVVVRTDFGLANPSFVPGETYIVFANPDPDGSLSSGPCSATRSITEAKELLPYLLSLELHGDRAGRIFGTATPPKSPPPAKDPTYPDFDPIYFVHLSAGSFERVMDTDDHGRFVFDGIPEGDYEISLRQAFFDGSATPILPPKTIRVGARACQREDLPSPMPAKN